MEEEILTSSHDEGVLEKRSVWGKKILAVVEVMLFVEMIVGGI